MLIKLLWKRLYMSKLYWESDKKYENVSKRLPKSRYLRDDDDVFIESWWENMRAAVKFFFDDERKKIH